MSGLGCLSSCLQTGCKSGESPPARWAVVTNIFPLLWETSTLSNSFNVWSQDPFILLQVINDPKKRLLIWAISTDIYHIRNEQQKT